MSISQNFPATWPSLVLDFANSKTLDPRITFTRASTGTYVGADGLIKTAAADEARFDHDPDTGESLGLLIEESRTNLVLQSEALDNAEWTKTGSLLPISINDAVSPDGNQTADVPSDISTKWGIYDASNSSWISGYPQVYPFTVTSEWTRQSLTFTAPAGCTSIRFYVLRTQNDASYVYDIVTVSAGTTYTASAYYKLHTDGTTVLAWGAQIEAGSFPTSYIPTSGSTVTRSADNTQITGTNFSDWYNQSEGTIYTETKVETNRSYTGTFRHPYQFTKTSTDSNDRIGFLYTSGGIFSSDSRESNSPVFTVASDATNTGNIVKVGMGVKTDDYAYSINGNTPKTSTSGTIPTLNYLYIGKVRDSNPLGQLNGHIKRFAYYPERLTNSQLQNLTK